MLSMSAILIILFKILLVGRVSAFTKDALAHFILSRSSNDATHSSLTETGIKLAVQQYFHEKNPNSPIPQSDPSSEPSFLNLFNLDSSVDSSLDAVFRLQYSAECVLDLVPYQTAVQEIIQGNTDMDTNLAWSMRADFHFDAEKMNESNANIILLRESAKTSVMKNQYAEARRALGRALHIIQDFYSHSNWVEMGNTKSSPGLGNPSNDFGYPLASPSTDTCKDCPNTWGECRDNLIVNDQLTTGYFKSIWLGEEKDGQGNPVVKPTAVKKCSHGGIMDTSAQNNPIGGINKDVGDLPGSQHYYLHHQAADVAELSTIEFILSFRKDIGDKRFEILLALKQPQCHSSRRRRSVDQDKASQKITILTLPNTQSIRSRVIHDQFSARHSVIIASAVGDLNKNPMIIPVDTTLEDMIIKITLAPGIDTSDTNILLISPRGTTHSFKSNLKNSTMIHIQIQSPEPGLWRIQMLDADTKFVITVLGISTWDAIINIMILEERMRHVMRPGMKVIKSEDPIQIGSTLYVYVMTPIESASINQLELRSMNGSFLKNIPVTIKPTLEDGFARNLFEIIVPDVKFRIVVRANDDMGYDVARTSEAIYTPRNLGTDSDLSISNHEMKPTHIEANFFAMDRNIALGVAAVTSFIVFLWMVAILAVILLKIAMEKWCTRKSNMHNYSGDV